MANLLRICTRALDEIGSFNVPTFIIGNDDDTAIQLYAMARKVGDELVRDYDWQECIRTATVTTAVDDSLYDLEDDYDRLCSDTMWNGTESRVMFGNATKRRWAAVTNVASGTTTTSYEWRLYRNQIQLNPAAREIFSFNYEYLSKVYCSTSVGVDNVDGWAADTDLPLLPADLFIHGVRFYFAKANNLPYGDLEAEYDAVVASRQNKNTPAQAVNMASGIRRPGRSKFYRVNIPEVIPT